MNLAKYLSGVISALKGEDRWPDFFDLSDFGFRESFFALVLSAPCYFICALAIQTERARVLEQVPAYPNIVFFLVLAVYSLIFVACAYIISVVFEKMERFKPWVIVRHWAIFFASFLAAMFYGLAYLGVLPFQIANFLALLIYLGTLVIDIRLAARIPGFTWGPAIFTGCIITGMSLTALIIGVAQFT